MKRKKPEIPKVIIEEDGVYECPECGDFNCLDSYEYTKLSNNGKVLITCPMCNTKLKLFAYEPDNHSEL